MPRKRYKTEQIMALLRQVGVLVANGRMTLEPMAVLAQAFELRSAHCAPPPSLWLMASYSDRSRTITSPS
jgi:hypothetical protein